MVVIHPRGPSDETTSLGQWVQRWKGSQLQAIKPSQLDDFCSANNCLQEGSKGVAEQGELQGGTLNAPSYPTASQTDPKGLYFIVVSFFRWPCYQIQADTPVDVWSNHACQVALFFPGVRTASSGGSVNLVLPRPQKMHPSATGTREPTGCVISKATKEACPGGLAVTGLGKECTLLPR